MRTLRGVWVLVLAALVAGPAGALPEGRPGATAQERQLGALAGEQIIRGSGLVRDDLLQARLDGVGATLTKHVPGGEVYRFRILKSDDVNALTTPDGQIFVTRQLLRVFKNDEDLAAVLAHEISHVLLLHTQKLLTEQDEVKTVEVRRRNGRVVRQQVTVTSDRKKNWEYEADVTGLELLEIAGYSKGAMERVLVYLTDEEARRDAEDPPSKVQELRSTHPRSAARLAELRRHLEERYASPRDPGPPATVSATSSAAGTR